MNWYFKQVLAQATLMGPPTQTGGMVDYLKGIGIGEDIINHIISLDIPTAQFLANEVRKNPGLTIMDLQQINIPKKIDPYSPFEKKTASNYPLEMQKWILVNMRKMRRRIDPNSITEDINRNYDHFVEKLDEIKDWFERSDPRPELASYDAFQAIEASDEWHRMMAGKGAGKDYEPTTKESIVYGPKWFDKEFNGWTIQEIASKNDLLAEGYKMDNCVGNYWNSIKSGDTKIYSVRDPLNNPVVTIETDGGDTVRQIQGHSNRYPDEDYIRMIYEWVNRGTNAPKKYDEGGPSDPWTLGGELGDIAYQLRDLISGHIGDEEYPHRGIGEECGLDTASESGEFRGWQQNFDVERLMDIVLESAEYSHYREPLGPEEINWHEDDGGIAINLLTVVEHFDNELNDKHKPYKKLLIQILNEESNRPYRLMPETDKSSKIRASFANYVLDVMKTPEDQEEFEFSYAFKKSNWYKNI